VAKTGGRAQMVADSDSGMMGSEYKEEERRRTSKAYRQGGRQ